MKPKPISLSHSACSKYMSCPKEYDYHYNQRIRPTDKSSALVFGGAIDRAMEALVLHGKREAKKVFNEEWVLDPVVVFHENDTDLELITQEQHDENAPFYSMKAKGHIMIDSFAEQVLPKIRRVIGTQLSKEFKNSEGDSFKSIPDLIVEWEDGRVLLLDVKTTSIPYDYKSVRVSTQLSAYKIQYEKKYKPDAYGYITLSKNIKKNRKKICSICDYDGSNARHKTCPNKRANGRCDGQWNQSFLPECVINVITDTISDEFSASVMDNVTKIGSAIKMGVFHQNFNSCKKGKDSYCSYYNLCYYGSMSKLSKV